MQINTQVGDQAKGTGRSHGWLVSFTCLHLKSSFSPPLPFRRAPFLLWLSVVAQTIKNPPAMRETWVRSLDQEDPLEEGMTTLVSLPGESHGQRSLAAYSPGSRRVGRDRATNTHFPHLLYRRPYQPGELGCPAPRETRPSGSPSARPRKTSRVLL